MNNNIESLKGNQTKIVIQSTLKIYGKTSEEKAENSTATNDCIQIRSRVVIKTTMRDKIQLFELFETINKRKTNTIRIYMTMILKIINKGEDNNKETWHWQKAIIGYN